MFRGVRSDSGPRDSRAGAPRAQLAGRQLLYVDDDEFLRRLSVRMLGSAGALCLTAGTHAEAIAIVNREPALDLVILDYHMADGDIGLLVGRLRAVRPALQLIGNSSENRRREFSERGIERFLEKPWKIDALVQAMRH